MREISTGLTFSSQIGGVQPVVSVASYCRAWRRAWSSSLRILLTVPGRVLALWLQLDAWWSLWWYAVLRV